MIEVSITSHGGKRELAKIRIENVTDYEILENPDYDHGDYSVQFVVDRCMAIGTHRRGMWGFPRTKYNVLGLLLQALNTLDPKELELEDGTSASDLAGEVGRTLPALQRRASRLHHH